MTETFSAPTPLELTAARLGARDLFVFRRVNEERFVHLGGVGRGEGWAGNLDVVLEDEPFVRDAVAADRVAGRRSSDARPCHIVGPYYARDAVAIPVSHDVVVVAGHPDALLARCDETEIRAAAAAAAHQIQGVSPAKRLADELELLHAVQAVMSAHGGDIDEVMRHVVENAAVALSCEFGALYEADSGRLAVASRGWAPEAGRDQIASLMRGLVARSSVGPVCEQEAALSPLPEPFADADGVTSYLLLPVGRPVTAVLLLLHTEAAPRGFTSLCRQVAERVTEAAELVLLAARARAQLEDEIGRVTEAARIDPMTGLANRLGWEEASALSAADRPSAVLVVDLNDLKAVNDRHGHATGDRFIKAAARALRGAARPQDVVARIGGDEFAVLIGDCDEPCAQIVASRVREAFAGEPPIEDIPLSAALGLAATGPGVDHAEAFSRADRAMYADKASRRATV